MIRLLIISLYALSLSILNLTAENHSDKHEFDSTYAHAVYFWLENPDNAADRSQFEQAAKTFMKDSQYAQTRFIGVAPKASREIVDDSFTYSLILTFESAEAQKKYQSEPAHDIFVATCKDLWAKVIVYDSIQLESE